MVIYHPVRILIQASVLLPRYKTLTNIAAVVPDNEKCYHGPEESDRLRVLPLADMRRQRAMRPCV